MRSRVEPRKPIFDPHELNEVWSANFEGTRAVFKRVFKVYGLPKQLHTDNGTPFGNTRAIGRFTRFEAWLMELGVEPIFSDPGHPEQNGRHERMHRDLRSAACQKPSKNFQSQQVRFNTFKKNYNENRSHESLNMKLPAQVHKKTDIPFKEKIDKWVYPETYMVKYICGNGIIRVGKKGAIFVGSALKGKKVGLEPLGNEIYKLYYRDFLLGYIDWNNLKAYIIND